MIRFALPYLSRARHLPGMKRTSVFTKPPANRGQEQSGSRVDGIERGSSAPNEDADQQQIAATNQARRSVTSRRLETFAVSADAFAITAGPSNDYLLA
jgi:hypothetical protein